VVIRFAFQGVHGRCPRWVFNNRTKAMRPGAAVHETRPKVGEGG
jgi:hypothetical protein